MSKKCPQADELAALVGGQAAGSRIAEHVSACSICAQVVANLRRDAELVSDLKNALEAPPDEEGRRELMRLCRAAGKDKAVT